MFSRTYKIKFKKIYTPVGSKDVMHHMPIERLYITIENFCLDRRIDVRKIKVSNYFNCSVEIIKDSRQYKLLYNFLTSNTMKGYIRITSRPYDPNLN